MSPNDPGFLSTFDAVQQAAYAAIPNFHSMLISVISNEARLMVAAGGQRPTQKNLDRWEKDAEERFANLVAVFYRTPRRRLSADDILDSRAIVHVAWAVAEKIRAHVARKGA